MVQRAFTPNMAGGLTPTCSPQSILCRIFFPAGKNILYHNKEKDNFSESREEDDFPETGRKAIDKSKKVSGGDKGPPQTGCSGMKAEMLIMRVSL